MLCVLGLKIVYRQWNSHLPCFRKMTHTSQLHGQKISAAIKFPFVSSLGANGLDPCLCFASHVPALSLRYSLVEIFRNKSEHKQDKTALSSSFNWMLYIASSVNISSWHYFFYYFLAVLFTVEAEQTKYTSEFGGDVVMKCRFQPVPSDTLTGLKVTWHWMKSNSVRKVYVMDDGKEHLSSQDPDFQGRVKLLTEELQKGWAELQVITGSDT